MTTRRKLNTSEADLTSAIHALELSRRAYKAHGRAGKQAQCTKDIAFLVRSRAAVRAWKARV